MRYQLRHYDKNDPELSTNPVSAGNTSQYTTRDAVKPKKGNPAWMRNFNLKSGPPLRRILARERTNAWKEGAFFGLGDR